MKQFITNSEKETKDLAEKLAQKFTTGIIALMGELGAGKTTFVQGFAKGLGVRGKIISPTLVLIRQHKIPNSSKTLFHIDLYRLDNENQFKSLGLEELFRDPYAIILVEWAEKAKNLLSKNTTLISFENISENQRKITITI